MGYFYIPPISEDEIDKVIIAAGGGRAHVDADRRDKRGADYVLGNAVIELKILEEDGLEKQERQAKLASLFQSHCSPERPVIVLDPNVLPEAAKRAFDRALEGPVKTAVRSAKEQLRQSRIEHPVTEISVLWVVNNGYTALDHESLAEMIAHRVRNDTANIDAIMVSGCYFYSDTFDSFFLWPFDYIPIRLDHTFALHDHLRAAWNAFATSRMTKLITSDPDHRNTKGPVVDTQFELDGVTYVKPAPPIGGKSKFFPNGRPRKDSTGLTHCPPVATVFGDLSYLEWQRCKEHRPSASWLGRSYTEWQEKREYAERTCSTKPLVAIPVSFEKWDAWAQDQPNTAAATIHRFAHMMFEERIQELLRTTLEWTTSSVVPTRYILVVTEEIGQDRANDVSHIMEICEYASGERQVEEILTDRRMFHEHALAVGCAYAVARQINVVMWQKDLSYAWC